MSDRLQVKQYSFEISFYDFEYSLDKVIEDLLQYKKEGWEGFDVFYGNYSDEKCLHLYKFREETDEEYKKRLEEELRTRRTAEKEREERRRQYEQLKKEFENE